MYLLTPMIEYVPSFYLFKTFLIIFLSHSFHQTLLPQHKHTDGEREEAFRDNLPSSLTQIGVLRNTKNDFSMFETIYVPFQFSCHPHKPTET